MAYVYYFTNETLDIIYVGFTKNIEQRIGIHFGSHGHLEKSCYDECRNIYFAEFKSTNEAKIYELYYISKFNPKYNTLHTEDSVMSIVLPDVDFKLYDSLKHPSYLDESLNLLRTRIEKNLNTIDMFVRGIEVLKSETPDIHTRRYTKTQISRMQIVNATLQSNVNCIKKELDSIRKTLVISNKDLPSNISERKNSL